MYVVNKEVMYTLLHIDSQQVFAGLVFIDAHFAWVSPSYIYYQTYVSLSKVNTDIDV